MKLIDQMETIKLMERYNNTPRRIIKENLLYIIKNKEKYETKDITQMLDITQVKVLSWFNMSSQNIPTFYDALRLATKCGVDIEEFINTERFGYFKSFKYPIEQSVKIAEYDYFKESEAIWQ